MLTLLLLSVEAKESNSKPNIGNGHVSRMLTFLSDLFFKCLGKKKKIQTFS